MRRSPIHHRVGKHRRQGRWVESYYRGSGSRKTQQRRIVVASKKIVIDPEHFGYGARPPSPRGKPTEYSPIPLTEDEKAVGFVEHPFKFDPSSMFIRTGFEGSKKDFLAFLEDEKGRPVSYNEYLKSEHRKPRHVFAYFDPQLLDAAEELYKKGYSTNYSQGYSYTWRKPGKDTSYIWIPARQLSEKTRRAIEAIPSVKVKLHKTIKGRTIATSDKYKDVLTLKPKKPVEIATIMFKYPRSKATPPTPKENQYVHNLWMRIVNKMPKLQ